MRLALAFLSVAAIIAAPSRAAAAMKFRPHQSIRDGYSLVVPAEWEERQEKESTVTFTGSTGVLVISLRPRGGCTPEHLANYAGQFVLSDKVKVLHQGK